MKQILSKSHIVILFSCFIFIAFAERPEAVKNEFVAHRQLQRESRFFARTSASLHSRSLIDGQGGTVFNSSNWSGAEQTSPPNGTFFSVSAQWIVPTLSLPPGASGDGIWESSVWVGIDGDGGCQGLLEAGTQSYIVVNSTGTTISSQAFYSWGPGAIFIIDTFPVKPGDSVEVTVNATSPSTGVVEIRNPNTALVQTVPVSPPINSSNLCGQTVEWIVEDAGMGNGFYPFGNFTNVLMQDCTALTTKGNVVNLTGAEMINMMQQSQGVLATAAVVNSSVLQVSYN